MKDLNEIILDKPIVLSEETFAQFVQKHKLVVVDCWAPWCGPCQMVGPVVEELAKDYVGKIVFGKLNVDENQKTAMKYQTMSIPTLLVFKDGNLIDRIVGALPKPLLEQCVKQYL